MFYNLTNNMTQCAKKNRQKLNLSQNLTTFLSNVNKGFSHVFNVFHLKVYYIYDFIHCN